MNNTLSHAEIHGNNVWRAADCTCAVLAGLMIKGKHPRLAHVLLIHRNGGEWVASERKVSVN